MTSKPLTPTPPRRTIAAGWANEARAVLARIALGVLAALFTLLAFFALLLAFAFFSWASCTPGEEFMCDPPRYTTIGWVSLLLSLPLGTLAFTLWVALSRRLRGHRSMWWWQDDDWQDDDWQGDDW